MASENETGGQNDEVEIQPPEYGRVENAKDISIRDGLYVLTNKMSRTVLDICHGGEGTPSCHGWSRHSLGDQIWIAQKCPTKHTYTLRNIEHGGFLDLGNGTPVIGYHRVEGSLNQEWQIVEHTPYYYTLQCARTNTYLEIPGGNSTPGTQITCVNEALEMDNQLWILDRVSRSGQEVQSIIEQWKPDLLPRLLLPHGEATEYLGLPGAHFRSLWDQTNLQSQPIRLRLFDYDQFVIKSKDRVHSWARDTFPAEIQGFSILFGIVYGEAKKGPKAYNWYLTSDMCSLVFFDPQTGMEYSAAGLNGFGFEPTFAML